MDSTTVLDFVSFQLSPTRTRCEIFASSGLKSEKLTSGILKPYLHHSETLKQQMSRGTSASIRWHPIPDNGLPPSWFTKGTLQRFFRFVRNPDILERIATIEMELMQLEETFRMQTRSASVSEKTSVPTSVSTSGSSLGGRKSTATCYENTKQDVQCDPLRYSSDSTGNSRVLLLQALEARRKVLQKDQEIAFACAGAAGFDHARIMDLLSFAESFGALRLRDACIKFTTSFIKRRSGSDLGADDARQSRQQTLSNRSERRKKSTIALEVQQHKADCSPLHENNIGNEADSDSGRRRDERNVTPSENSSASNDEYSLKNQRGNGPMLSTDDSCKETSTDETQKPKRGADELPFLRTYIRGTDKSSKKTPKLPNVNITASKKYASQGKMSRLWNSIYRFDHNHERPPEMIMLENELFEEEREDDSTNVEQCNHSFQPNEHQMSVRDFVSIYESKCQRKQGIKEAGNDRRHGSQAILSSGRKTNLREDGGSSLKRRNSTVMETADNNGGGAQHQKKLSLLYRSQPTSEDRVKRFLDRYNEKRVSKLRNRFSHPTDVSLKENKRPDGIPAKVNNSHIQTGNNKRPAGIPAKVNDSHIQTGNLRRNPGVLQEIRRNEKVEELAATSAKLSPLQSFKTHERQSKKSEFPDKTSTDTLNKQRKQPSSSSSFLNEKARGGNPTESYSNASSAGATEVTLVTGNWSLLGKGSKDCRQDPKGFLKKGSGLRSRVGATVLRRHECFDREFVKTISETPASNKVEIELKDSPTKATPEAGSVEDSNLKKGEMIINHAGNEEIVEVGATEMSKDSQSEVSEILVTAVDNISAKEVERNVFAAPQMKTIEDTRDSTSSQPVVNSGRQVHEAFVENAVWDAKTPNIQCDADADNFDVLDDSFVTPLCFEANETSITDSSHERLHRFIGTGASDVSSSVFQHLEAKWGTSRHISFIDSNTPSGHGRDLKWFQKFGFRSSTSHGYDRVCSYPSDMHDENMFGEGDGKTVACYGRRRHSNGKGLQLRTSISDSQSCMASPVEFWGRSKKERGGLKVVTLQRSASTRGNERKNADSHHHARTSSAVKARSFFSLTMPFRRKLQKENC